MMNKERPEQNRSNMNEIQLGGQTDTVGQENLLVGLQNRLESAMEPNHFADVLNRQGNGTQLGKHNEI